MVPLGFAVALIAMLIGCSPAAEGYDRLKAEPEAGLLYPGSERLDDGGYEAELTIDGSQPAAFWLILGSDASIDEIRDFYERELAARGWEVQPSSRSTSEVEAYRWHRGDLAFRLGFKDPEEWHQRIEGSDRFATLYEIRLNDGVEQQSP